ncbi:MAG TPA: sulfatase [Gemmatimonadaceae bacterium]|nr:sulfatase [Gemmatimonadaceae bacterium]
MRWFCPAVFVVLAACGSKKAAHDDAPAPKDDDAAAADAMIDAAPEAAEAPSPARPEHEVYDLVDNRHAAHRSVDGELVIDASTVSFARYTRFGVPVQRWAMGQEVGGKRAAIADRFASLEVPLAVEQAKAAVQLTARVHGGADGDGLVLALKVNGREASKDARVELAPGWQTIALAIEPGRLRVGENQVAFETTVAKSRSKSRDKKKPDKKAPAPKVAFEWLRFGAARTPTDEDPRAAIAFDPEGALDLARDAGVTYFVTVPEGAHLVADVAPPCRVDVRARPSAEAFAGGMLGAPGARVDLTPMAGRVVALSLVARECPRARIGAPRITLHGPGPQALPKAPPPKYVVLWVMDALRADKIPIFTPGARAQTPNFDELAKSSAVFRQYYVQGNESQTSHSSMWSGVYPAVHNVRMAGVGGVWKLDARFPVIASKLAEAGLFTTGVTGNGFVTADGGYARGFKQYRNMMREKGVINGILYGQQVVDAALGQLDKVRSNPAYLFLGTIDTHGPWIARKPWIDIYSPGPYRGPFQEFGTAKGLGFKPGKMGCSIIPPPADIERLRAIYDSAISYHDQQLGRLIAQLKSWGIWDQTMLVITADHGEEFFEDRRCGHGGSLRDSLVRVPLLIYDPARFPGGTIVDEGVEGVDLLPTFVDAIGGAPVDGVQGASLVKLAQGEGRGWPRPSYASQYEYAHAMRIGRWKIRVGKTGVPLVGDLVGDPGEQQELSAEKPVERRMLTDNLSLFLALRAKWTKSTWGVVTNITPAGAAALDQVAVP